MNFIGGVAGGSMFELNRLKIEPMLSGRALTPETQYSLINLVANGKAGEIKAEIDKRAKNIGVTSLPPAVAKDGEEDILMSENGLSQSDLIGFGAKSYVDTVDRIMNSENLGQDDESVIQKAILDKIKTIDLESTGIEKFILSDFRELSAEIIALRAQQDTTEDADEKSTITAKLKEKRDQAEELLTGEKAEYYHGLSLFSLNADLHSPFINLDVVNYTKYKYKTKYHSLPEEGGALSKKSVNEEFAKILDAPDNKKEKLKFMYATFNEFNARFSETIGNYAEEAHLSTRQKTDKLLENEELLTPAQIQVIQPKLRNANLPVYDLTDVLKLPLGDFLKDNGVLDIKGLSEETIEKQLTFLNSINLPLKDFNPAFLSDMIATIKKQSKEALNTSRKAEEMFDTADMGAIEEKYKKLLDELESSTPVLKNAQSLNTFDFNAMFINNNFRNEKFLTSEMYEILSEKHEEMLNRVRNEVLPADVLTNIDVDGEFLSPHIQEDPEDLASYMPFLEQMTKDFLEFKKSMKDAATLEELNTAVAETVAYIENIGENYLAFVKTIKTAEEILQQGVSDDVIIFTNNIKASSTNIKIIDNSILLEAEQLLEKPVYSNELLKILSDIKIEIFSGENSNELGILEVLQSELDKFSSIEKPQDYIRSKQVVENMRKSIETINLVGGINVAMLDSAISPSKPYGYNVSLNNYSNKNEDIPAVDYKVITGDAHHLLNKELGRIVQKLEFLIELSELNDVSVHQEQIEIRENAIDLFTKALTSKDSTTSALNIKINGKTLLEPDEVASIMGTSKSEEEKLYDLEELIHKKFKAMSKGDLENSLKQLTEPFSKADVVKSLADVQDIGITKDSTFLENKDYITYLHSIIAVNTKTFYSKYKNILQKELSLDNTKSPFFLQEYAIRLGYAFIKNKEVMGNVMGSFERNTQGDNASYRGGLSIIKDIMLITGTGGVGKTTVIANFLLRMVQEDDINFIASAPSMDTVNTLKKDIGKDIGKNIDMLDNNELLEKILGKDNYEAFKLAESALLEKTKDGVNIKDTNIPETNPIIHSINSEVPSIELHEDFLKDIASNLDKETVIIADEISWTNPLILQIIDYLAIKGKIHFIGMGDNYQAGFSLSNKTPYSLESIYTNSAPRLKGVVRSNNLHKKDNIETLEVLMRNRLQALKDHREYTGSGKINYYEEIYLKGDKFVEELSLEELKKLDPALKTAIITEDGELTSDLKSKLADVGLTNLEIIHKDRVQGREFSQVVSTYKIDVDVMDAYSVHLAFKQLNTILSRAKDATLFLGNKPLLEKLGLSNVKKTTVSSVEFDDTQAKKFLEDRYNFLEKILKDYSPEVGEEEKAKEVKETDLLDDGIPVEPEEIFPPKKEAIKHDGDKQFFTYPFFNVLHAEEEKDGKIKIDNYQGIPSDMQTLKMFGSTIYDEHTRREGAALINDFLQVKHTLLHKVSGFTDVDNVPKSNPFQMLLQAYDGELVVRKLKYDEKFITTYGKQSHMPGGKPKLGNSYLFLTYKGYLAKNKGNPFYVTLSSMPDFNNGAWTQKQNKKHLEEVFDSLEPGAELKVNAKPHAYSGIKLIYKDGATKLKKGEDSGIEITGDTVEEFLAALIKDNPGLQVSDMSKIRTFWKYPDKIKKTLESVGYSYKGKTLNIKTPSGFRFRPFITVSYVNTENKEVSRIITLSPRSRKIGIAKEEYVKRKMELAPILAARDVAKVKEYTLENFPVLINPWAGIELLNYIIHSTNMNTNDKILNRLKKAEIRLPYSKIKPAKQEQFYNELNRVFEILKTKGKTDGKLTSVLTQEEIFDIMGSSEKESILPNLGLRLLEILSKEEIESIADREIYYNPIFKPKGTEQGERLMDGSFIKYFKINSHIEPPTFIIDFNDLGEIEKVVKETAEVIQLEEVLTKANKLILPDGVEINIDLSNWTNEELLERSINVLYKAYVTTLNKILRSDLSIEEKERVKNINRAALQKVLAASSFMSSNNKANRQLLRKAVELFKTEADNTSELSDEAFSNNYYISDNLLNKVDKSIITKDICKYE